jgi:hypothetical protein
MSTNPGTSLNPSPLSRRRFASRLTLALLGGGTLLLLAWPEVSVHLSEATAHLMGRREERSLMASQLAEARRLDLDYAEILSGGAASVGRPVLWCVDYPGRVSAYAGGKPSQVVLWENPDAVPDTVGTTSGGRCWNMLLVVAKVQAGVPTLRYVGLP